jgi:hypothetical protein
MWHLHASRENSDALTAEPGTNVIKTVDSIHHNLERAIADIRHQMFTVEAVLHLCEIVALYTTYSVLRVYT